MNIKAILMLCLIFFSFASTIATITIAFGEPKPEVLCITRTFTYHIESAQDEPIGDPIDSEFMPM